MRVTSPADELPLPNDATILEGARPWRRSRDVCGLGLQDASQTVAAYFSLRFSLPLPPDGDRSGRESHRRRGFGSFDSSADHDFSVGTPGYGGIDAGRPSGKSAGVYSR